MGNTAAHLHEVGGVTEDKGGAIAGPQKIIKLTLPFFHAFGAAKAFEMGFADVGDDTMCRKGIRAVGFDLFLMVGAHFDDGQLCIPADRKQGERDADMVVEIPLCRIGDKGGGQGGMDKLFGGRLAVAAGDGDKGDAELPPVVERQLLQSREHVGDEDQLVGGIRRQQFQLRRGFVKDGVGRAKPEGADRKSIPIEVGAFKGKKEVAALQLPGVRPDRRVAEINIVKLFDRHAAKIRSPENNSAYSIFSVIPPLSYSHLV